MARTHHIFSRRALLKGTAATAATAVAVDMLYGCKSLNSTDAASSSVVVDDSSGTDVLEEYTYDESTVDAASTWSLPLGCVLHPAEGTWIPVTAAGAKASPLITGSALDTSSGTLKTVIAQPISSDSNMEIYDARCSDSAYAWVEINILNRSWKLYGQAFSDGAVTGTASLLWEADSNWDPPALAVSGSKVIWQVQPSTSGSSTKESSHCYLWKTGDSSAKAVIESSGRFGCDISISDGNAILAPRVNASSGTYYGITAYSLSDDMGTVTDQLVLPQSVKPMCATRIGDEFVFSIEANYSTGGLLASMGTYVGHGDGPFLSIGREPFCVSSGKDDTYIVKVRASYYVIDTANESYRVISAVDRSLDYGEYPARMGACDTFVTFATVKDASTGYPSAVTVRTFNL